MKEGKTELIWADTIEDIEEVAEDDIDTNKTADADGDDWSIIFNFQSLMIN